MIDIADAMRPEVDEHHVARQCTHRELTCCLSDDDLPAVCGIPKARCLVQGDAHGARSADRDVSGMHGHAHAPRRIWPDLGEEAPLRGHRHSHRSCGRRENGGETVAFRSELFAVLSPQCGSDELVMPSQHGAIAIAEGAEVSRRPFQVREQQTVRSRVEVRHVRILALARCATPNGVSSEPTGRRCDGTAAGRTPAGGPH